MLSCNPQEGSLQPRNLSCQHCHCHAGQHSIPVQACSNVSLDAPYLGVQAEKCWVLVRRANHYTKSPWTGEGDKSRPKGGSKLENDTFMEGYTCLDLDCSWSGGFLSGSAECQCSRGGPLMPCGPFWPNDPLICFEPDDRLSEKCA